ncbi:MAG: hypothetical protein MJ247_07175 [Alphaproteobacteria bacterium]|nr:hypothetical protein [Alphaproteobacteria bacterium]
MFEDKSEQELLELKSKFVCDNNTIDLANVEKEISNRLDLFLNKDFGIDVDDSPMFFEFIKEAQNTDNVDLKVLAKQCEVKIVPILKQFDSENGIDIKETIPSEIIERNIDDIEKYEAEDLSQKEDFRQIFSLLNKIELVDDNENPIDSKDYLDSLEKTTKLKAYLRLCLKLAKVTSREYFSALKDEYMSALLSIMIIENGWYSDSEEEIKQKFDKLLDAVD